MSVDIALYLPGLQGGGAEYVMLQLANGFVGEGFRTDLVLNQAQGTYLKQLDASVRIVDLFSSNTYRAFPRLVEYLGKENPRTMLSTLDLTNLASLLACRLARTTARSYIRVANTVSIQYRSPLKKPLEHLMLAAIYPWAERVICVSRGVADDLLAYTGMVSSKVRVIYNPVIRPEISDLASRPVHHPWFEKDALPIVLGVGRLTTAKDFSTLILAFAAFRKRKPSRLVILGEGADRPSLEALTERLGITADVWLAGFVENPFAYMSKAAVFVLSSRWEGLPNVLIQALSVGTPVVSTDCPSGPSEILREGKYGHLVPVGDPVAMAGAMEAALDGDARIPPRDWLDQYKVDHVVREYLGILDLL